MILAAATESRNQILTVIGMMLDAGMLQIYDGRRPTSPDDSVSDQTLLASIPFASPAFGVAINGVIGARPMEPPPALASGTASWARLVGHSGRAVFDIDVGESGAALNLTSTQLHERGPVRIKAFVLRMPAS